MNVFWILFLLFFQSISNRKVFEETKVKNIKLKNRLFKGGVFDFTFENGKMTERGLKYYEEYAKNEVGSIITGGILIDNNFKLGQGYFVIDDDKYIPDNQKLTSLMHKYNTRIFGAISPSGYRTVKIKDSIFPYSTSAKAALIIS